MLSRQLGAFRIIFRKLGSTKKLFYSHGPGVNLLFGSVNPTHAAVLFDAYQTVAMIPSAKIVEPSFAAIKCTDKCIVRWSNKRPYSASVIAISM